VYFVVLDLFIARGSDRENYFRETRRRPRIMYLVFPPSHLIRTDYAHEM